MSTTDDDILNDLFHACALQAFIAQAIAQGGPPDQDATRKRAFRYYEEALAEKNARQTCQQVDVPEEMQPPETAIDGCNRRALRANQAGGESPAASRIPSGIPCGPLPDLPRSQSLACADRVPLRTERP
jgi:hypothetical protein